ncbi:GcrA family cell cycle regulator [Roseomonas sp. HJA6]|uniref:GcrA family cell cycle regulator n=1 Tax=Roseomonas alba TaxID=2846776 RepID=A0ABS7A422_9PROT|nr:GcrA family cell cycle regulator [Neoroseomonas alba]
MTLPQRGACCWPIGEPRSPDYRTCDAPRQRGSSYCAEHHARAYRVVPAMPARLRRLVGPRRISRAASGNARRGGHSTSR